jgi:hypothetical protein
MIHGQTPTMLVRRVGDCWILHGHISVTVWMPDLSRAELRGAPGGPIPGWRAALAILVGMGVDIAVPADEIECAMGDGMAGTSYVWPEMAGVKPLPQGIPAFTSWEHCPSRGSLFRVTAANPGVTPTTLLWHVGFTTTAAAAALDQEVVMVGG